MEGKGKEGKGKEKETFPFGKQAVCRNAQYTADKILTLWQLCVYNKSEHNCSDGLSRKRLIWQRLVLTCCLLRLLNSCIWQHSCKCLSCLKMRLTPGCLPAVAKQSYHSEYLSPGQTARAKYCQMSLSRPVTFRGIWELRCQLRARWLSCWQLLAGWVQRCYTNLLPVPREGAALSRLTNTESHNCCKVKGF